MIMLGSLESAYSGLPISVNWTFFAMCYGWGATSEYRLKIGDFAPTGAGWPKFSENWAKWSFVWYKKICTDLFSVLSQSTRLTDRQTDSFRIARPRLHPMQCGKIGGGASAILNFTRNEFFNNSATSNVPWCTCLLPHCMQCTRGIAMRILFVCQTRGLWQNGITICPDFYTISKIV